MTLIAKIGKFSKSNIKVLHYTTQFIVQSIPSDIVATAP